MDEASAILVEAAARAWDGSAGDGGRSGPRDGLADRSFWVATMTRTSSRTENGQGVRQPETQAPCWIPPRLPNRPTAPDSGPFRARTFSATPVVPSPCSTCYTAPSDQAMGKKLSTDMERSNSMGNWRVAVAKGNPRDRSRGQQQHSQSIQD